MGICYCALRWYAIQCNLIVVYLIMYNTIAAVYLSLTIPRIDHTDPVIS